MALEYHLDTGLFMGLPHLEELSIHHAAKALFEISDALKKKDKYVPKLSDPPLGTGKP
jgi:hypothetical protein